MFPAAYRIRMGRACLGGMRRALAALAMVALFSCASSGTPRPRPFPAPPEDASSDSGSIGVAIADAALALRGVPYRNGGSDPSGFDCSGLVWYVLAQHGRPVPRTVGEQFGLGIEVDPASLRKGDLVFFRTSGRGATHVGIMIGSEEFVHAPSSTGEVRVERLSSRYWIERLVGARRLDATGSRVPGGEAAGFKG